MNRTPIWQQALLCLALAVGCSGSGGRDAAINENLRSAMARDPVVQAADVSISTREGVVTLEGNVPDELARLRALDLVRQTAGVVDVVDRLRVLPAAMPAVLPPPAPRAVRATLRAPRRPASPPSQTGTATPQLVPVRTGEIDLGVHPPSAEQDVPRQEPVPERDASSADAHASAPDVSPARPALDFPVGMTEEDAAISADVRAKVDAVAPSGRIQVVTRQGVVTLSGAVDTELEKSQALEAARQARGVQRVEDRLLVLRS